MGIRYSLCKEGIGLTDGKVMHRSKSIIHLDMDAFYPAVEVLDHPELRGKPVIVGGSRERGVVSSASYEARRYGVHSAQPMATAARLCPHAVFLPVRMARYKSVSKQVMAIFHRFTPLVEPLSIDEAFLDVTGSERLFGDAVHIAKQIKGAVFREVGLTVSAGVAPSKFVAKIASDMDKPDGLTIVPPKHVTRFLDPLPVSKMWGVGKVTRKALADLEIYTFKELRSTPTDLLVKTLGQTGARIKWLSMGVDEREVVVAHETKSIGHEQTFRHDICSLDDARAALLALADKVGRRMRGSGFLGKTVSLKVKYHNFKQITRAVTLDRPTDDGFAIYAAVCGLLTKTGAGKRPIRLLGISLSGLTVSKISEQLSLFNSGLDRQHRKNVNIATDVIIDKHGDKSIRPATLFPEE